MKLLLISLLVFLGTVGILAGLAPNEGQKLERHSGYAVREINDFNDDDTRAKTFLHDFKRRFNKNSLRKVRDSEGDHDGSGEGDGNNKGEGDDKGSNNGGSDGGNDGASKGNSSSTDEPPNNSTNRPGSTLPSIPGVDEFQHFFSYFFHEFQYDFACAAEAWANVTRAFLEEISRNPTAKRTIKLEINDRLIYEETVENGTLSCGNNSRPHQRPNLIQEGVISLFGNDLKSKRRHGQKLPGAKRLHKKEHDRSKKSRKGKGESSRKHQRHHLQRKRQE